MSTFHPTNPSPEPQTMTTRTLFRKAGVFLVQVGDHFALIDPQSEQVVAINQSGAWVWSQLGTGTSAVAADQHAFLVRLQDLGLLGTVAAEPCMVPPPVEELPAVLGTAPLQVAANNSADPFSSASW